MNSDEKLFSGRYGKPKEGEERKDGEAEIPDAAGDCYESPQRDGVWCNGHVAFCMFTDNFNETWMVPYGSVILGVGPHGGRTYRIKFYAGEDLWEIELEGPQIGVALAAFAMSKRMTWHKGDGTHSITVRKVEQPEG